MVRFRAGGATGGESTGGGVLTGGGVAVCTVVAAARRRASTSVRKTPRSAPRSSITTISVISGMPVEKSTKSTSTFFEFLITNPITYSATTARTPMTP